MCLIFSKGPWYSKNKEPEKMENVNLVCISRDDLPYEWSYSILPLSKQKIDLNSFIQDAIKKDRILPLDVKKKPHGKFRDIKCFIPKKILKPMNVMIPVILKDDKEKIGMVTPKYFSEVWVGMGEVVVLSSAIHHKDRHRSLSPSIILSKIMDFPFDEAMGKMEEMLKKFNVAGFNGIVGDDRDKAVIDHLLEQTEITYTIDGNMGKKPTSIISRILSIFFPTRMRGIGYNDLIVRSNFSPVVGYWKDNWFPDETSERKVKIIRSLNRYIRSQNLIEKSNKINFEFILDAMSDHGVYSEVERKYEKYYKTIMRDLKKKLIINSKTEGRPGFYSICTHPNKIIHSDASTIYNFTANVKKKEVFITLGNPCRRMAILKYRLV